MVEHEPKYHRPVLVREVLCGLDVRSRGFYVDGTLGGGGHTREILKNSGPDGRVLGIDWDPEALRRAGGKLEAYGARSLLYEGNYAEIDAILHQLGIERVDGILLDLGASYEQLTSGERGFSMYAPGVLDMRYSPQNKCTAREIVNHWSERELKVLFRTYGEERWAGRIARGIVRSRPVATTQDLANLIARVVPRKRTRLHPATRVFQSLRIEVNQELTNLERGIRRGAEHLLEGGRLCVISYHSLEDRLVKGLFKEIATGEGSHAFCVLTRKPIRPGEDEVRSNPGARSAKLRILQKDDQTT
jgi:16S rRNA (cytosine1402-N4)-methyltransferase